MTGEPKQPEYLPLQREVLYEIAMSIGISLDMQAMLGGCLPIFLRGLGGTKVIVFESGDANSALRPVRVLPRNADFGDLASWLTNFPGDTSSFHFETEKGSWYIWRLPDFGVLAMAHRGLTTGLVREIEQLARKLANALLACRQYEQLDAALAAVEKTEQRWLMALDTGHGVWDWNARTNKVFFSRRWKSMLGYAEHEVGDDISEWSSRVHPDDLARCYADLDRHFRGETSLYRNEHRMRAKGGSWRWILDQGMVFERDEQGNPMRVVGTHTDITENKRLEQELVAARDRALAADRIKSEFLANMSHEIRTPMNGVLGMLSLLSEGPLTEEQREWLVLAKDSGKNLMTVINDILDFSKIEAGKLDICVEPVDLRRTADEVVQLMEIGARAKNLTLSFTEYAGLPARIMTDAARLRQILLNLLGNAVKFTEKGGVTLSIDREYCEGSPDCFHFCVADTGIGMSPEALGSAFDAFTQADGSITRRFGGTGLGLTISSRLVQLLGGRLWAESELGLGSRFHLVLHCAPDRHTGELPRPEDAPAVVPPENLTILLAEDNVINQKLACTILSRHGKHRVDVASTGREAVEKWRAGKTGYDLILMDMMMPEMDGIEATHIIREEELRSGAGHRIPIVAMTANAMERDRERCLAAGMDNFISKPFSVQALNTVIAQQMQKGAGSLLAGGS